MFIQFNENPRDNFHAGDCVVRAISVITGDPWEKIYVELCGEGYLIGDWGNNNAVWDSYLRRRGFKRYVCPNECSYCYSVEDFANDHPTGSYILASGNHAIGLISGNWYDSWNSASVPVIYYYVKEGD